MQCSVMRPTSVVSFDPSYDLAVMRVGGLADPPLVLDPTTVGRGTGAAGLGSLMVNSLKNAPEKARRTPGIFSSSATANSAFARFCSAISRKPSLPSSVRCTVAANAHKA